MAIKIEMLRCFVAVARSGNLIDAAEMLSRTPSAVSMMLKQFEAHLGSPLFESKRKSKLTALGDFTLGEASRELAHFARTIESIETFARSESGFVRVAAVPSVAGAILPKVTQEFLRDRPQVRIDIRDMDSNAVIRELESGRADLGIASGAGAGAELDRQALFSDAFGVICRADHPLAHARLSIDWDKLLAWPFIANGLCSHIDHQVFQQVFAGSKLMVRSTTSLLAMVRAGVGLTVLPRLVIHGTEQELVFVPVTDLSARRHIDILCRGQAALSPAAQQFAESVRRIARETADAG